jgi:uridine kinase
LKTTKGISLIRCLFVYSNFDFDHPSAFDYDLLFECLCKLKAGKSIDLPIYNFSKHAREEKTTSIYGANVIIFEGIFALYDQKIRDLMDLKVRLGGIANGN